MNNTTVVIGAGIAGLLLARRLKQAGCDVLVLEKSRGFGGRMATKRVGPAVFDQGAQYFTAKSPQFQALVAEWCERGWAEPWTAGGHRRFVGRPGMTAIPKGLAEGLRVLRQHKVTAARRHECGCWELDVEDHGIVRAERLLLTAPLPQSLALLEAGGVALPPPLADGLAAVDYNPCLALLLTLDGPSGLPEEGVAFAEGPVRWLADNTAKGVSPGGAGAVTVHAGPEYSRTNYAAAESEVAAALLPAIAGRLKSAVVATTVHRWRYCEPRTTWPERAVWLPELTLGFAGDAFGGPRVEGAALSGLALAEEVVKVLKPL
ncbi:MAG: FAD-dependent oxidoreductase [Verrucomicrobiota bacterium]